MLIVDIKYSPSQRFQGRKNEGEEGRNGKGTSAKCHTLAFLRPGVP